MKSLLKFPLLVAVATMMSCSFSACSDNDDPTPDTGTSETDAKFEAIAKQYLDHTVYVTYKNLADETEQLVKDLQALKSSKTDANVKATCKTFLEARAWWEKSEAFLYGAATDFGIDPHIDSWPLDLDGLQTALKNTEQVEAMGGEDGDIYAGEKLGNSLLGFHGIEYILFEDGSPKSVSKISDLHLTYAVAVAGDLRNRCWQLELSWRGESAVNADRVAKVANELELPYTVNSGEYSYGENMLNAGKAGSTYASWTLAMQAIIDGCKTIADEVGTSKIGKPYSGEDPAYIESPYSHKSILDFYDNIISIQNAYMGGIENERDETNSLHNYIAGVDKELDTKVVNAINNALTKINAMAAPFVNNIKDPSAGEAIKACQDLDAILSDVKTALRNN
ncbi:imelysin family protein [Phocaeicola dorei]|jgi:iron uptake system EfeUOB component EfeO/EfeM|uniref:imelysin family protein n=1 Tax=Phocaeicola dorei TaxID=357276 RepID=UPI0011114D80|nr:imelysin family protein [Phocaeicola dorei]